jgi:hypothetical protein
MEIAIPWRDKKKRILEEDLCEILCQAIFFPAIVLAKQAYS